MIQAKRKSQYWMKCPVIGIGLLLGTGVVNAAFFDDVYTGSVAETVDDEPTYMWSAVTTPDGRFTYTAGTHHIFIFSRDSSTGALSEVGVLNAASYPGGNDGVSFNPDYLIVSPDGAQLYMSGRFGWTSGNEGGAPMASTSSVFKFDIDSATGSLTYSDYVIREASQPPSMSNPELSEDGSLLFFAAGNGLHTEVSLVTTANMEAQFSLIDDAGVPNSVQMQVELSPDENTLYVSGTETNNTRKEPLPALAVIDVNPKNLDVRQTLLEQFFAGTDEKPDISNLYALTHTESIIATDDGQFVYTSGRVNSDVERSGSSVPAIGVWRVESDGNLSLVRSMDRQELVGDVIGDDDTEFSLQFGLALSPKGDHFLYANEDQFSKTNLTVFDRNAETGLLTYIDDSSGVVELDGVLATDVVYPGRYINLIQEANSRTNTLTVVDTSVDRSVVLNAGSTQVLPGESTSLQAIVSNSGISDDYAMQLLVEATDNLSLSTDDDRCSALDDGNVLCIEQYLLTSDQVSFDLTATASQNEGVNSLVATASSNKIDVDEDNDSDTVSVSITSTPGEDEAEPVDDDVSPETDATDTSTSSGGSGGCSVGGLRTGYDLSFLVLVLISGGLVLRRKVLRSKA